MYISVAFCWSYIIIIVCAVMDLDIITDFFVAELCMNMKCQLDYQSLTP